MVITRRGFHHRNVMPCHCGGDIDTAQATIRLNGGEGGMTDEFVQVLDLAELAGSRAFVVIVVDAAAHRHTSVPVMSVW